MKLIKTMLFGIALILFGLIAPITLNALNAFWEIGMIIAIIGLLVVVLPFFFAPDN